MKVTDYSIFDQWNCLKKEIHKTKGRPYFKTREVWWASVGHNIGDEQYGKHENFERPVLIISKFYRNLALVLPISSKVKTGSYYFSKTINMREGSIILSQARVVDTKRLIRKIETIDADDFERIIRLFKDLI